MTENTVFTSRDLTLTFFPAGFIVDCPSGFSSYRYLSLNSVSRIKVGLDIIMTGSSLVSELVFASASDADEVMETIRRRVKAAYAEEKTAVTL